MGDPRGPLAVLLVESETLVRAGLRALLERESWLRVAGEAECAVAAMQLFADLRPDVAIISSELRGESGLELIARLAAACPDARIVALVGSYDPVLHRMAKRLGANATLTKYDSPGALLRALTPARSASRKAGCELATTNVDVLSKRECEVCDLVAVGLRNRQIAERLFICEGTVRRHLSSIFAKTGVTSRTQLAITTRGRTG